jgi:RNHCP domain
VSYSRNQRSQHQSYMRRNRSGLDEQGFTCRHCALYVPCDPALAGVQNRNHCPYCLWSRHLDWRIAGDRLAGCRAAMQPIGLTIKRSRNKYARARDGELMLIHRCTICAKVAINRIAADDYAAAIMQIFDGSAQISADCQAELDRLGVSMLRTDDGDLVWERLFGRCQVGTPIDN